LAANVYAAQTNIGTGNTATGPDTTVVGTNNELEYNCSWYRIIMEQAVKVCWWYRKYCKWIGSAVVGNNNTTGITALQ
jgi:hypothetical protein